MPASSHGRFSTDKCGHIVKKMPALLIGIRRHFLSDNWIEENYICLLDFGQNIYHLWKGLYMVSYNILSFRACFWSISAPRSWVITKDRTQAVLTHARGPCLETRHDTVIHITSHDVVCSFASGAVKQTTLKTKTWELSEYSCSQFPYVTCQYINQTVLVKTRRQIFQIASSLHELY